MPGLTMGDLQKRIEAVPEENAAVDNVILSDAELAVDETGNKNFEYARALAYEDGDANSSTVEISCIEAHPTHPKISFKCDCGQATANVETASLNRINPCRHVIALFNEMDFDDLIY